MFQKYAHKITFTSTILLCATITFILIAAWLVSLFYLFFPFSVLSPSSKNYSLRQKTYLLSKPSDGFPTNHNTMKDHMVVNLNYPIPITFLKIRLACGHRSRTDSILVPNRHAYAFPHPQQHFSHIATWLQVFPPSDLG